MDQEFLIYLPPELIINILSRLPIKSVVRSKCVSKSWFQLLHTREFTNSHLLKSRPGIIVYLYKRNSEFIKNFEFVEELGLDHQELHYNLVTEFDSRAVISPLHHSISVDGSVHGLLFLRAINTKPQAMYICNPITREFIDLPRLGIHTYPTIVTYGFGISKTTGQYKVVWIFHECIRDPDTHSLPSIPKSKCEVYTLGTGLWRSVAPDYSHEYDCRSFGAFLNGNLHWLVEDLKGNLLISCFDLETEWFSVFLPPNHLLGRRRLLGSLTVLEDQLCVCDNTPKNEIVIWIMKEYGVEKSWEKTFVISKVPDFAGECYEVVYPLKVFRDGDILMWWDELHLFYYSNRTKSTRTRNLFSVHARLHVPSFVSLKSFVMENVRSF